MLLHGKPLPRTQKSGVGEEGGSWPLLFSWHMVTFQELSPPGSQSESGTSSLYCLRTPDHCLLSHSSFRTFLCVCLTDFPVNHQPEDNDCLLAFVSSPWASSVPGLQEALTSLTVDIEWGDTNWGWGLSSNIRGKYEQRLRESTWIVQRSLVRDEPRMSQSPQFLPGPLQFIPELGRGCPSTPLVAFPEAQS